MTSGGRAAIAFMAATVGIFKLTTSAYRRAYRPLLVVAASIFSLAAQQHNRTHNGAP